MAGADFSALDPSAFYKGAANMNALMAGIARQKAGSMIAAGDPQGGMNTLNQDGQLDAADQVQQNMDQHHLKEQGQITAQQAQNVQMVQDAASVLDGIRQSQGDAAVPQAFEQLVPIFKARGISDEQLNPIRQGLQNNPQQMLATIHSLATEHMKVNKLSPGDALMKDNGEVVGALPATPVVKTIPAGGSLVQVPGAPSPQVGAKMPTFIEGQVYTDAQGNKAKYQSGQWIPVQ